MSSLGDLLASIERVVWACPTPISVKRVHIGLELLGAVPASPSAVRAMLQAGCESGSLQTSIVGLRSVRYTLGREVVRADAFPAPSETRVFSILLPRDQEYVLHRLLRFAGKPIAIFDMERILYSLGWRRLTVMVAATRMHSAGALEYVDGGTFRLPLDSMHQPFKSSRCKRVRQRDDIMRELASVLRNNAETIARIEELVAQLAKASEAK